MRTHLSAVMRFVAAFILASLHLQTAGAEAKLPIEEALYRCLAKE
jgi:hypothetical protein